MVNNLFGLFFAIFHINIVFGNIISSTVIGDGFPSFSDVGNFSISFSRRHSKMMILGNANQSEIDSLRAKCGLNQVNEPSSCEAGAIDDQTLYLLMGKPNDQAMVYSLSMAAFSLYCSTNIKVF